MKDSRVEPQENLRLRVLSGLRWTASLRFLGQVLTWFVTILVMRKLSPQDYGLMGMAGVAIVYLTSINELGLGAAIVQKTSIDDKLISQIFGLLIIINMGLYLLCFVSAPLIASFFNESRLVPLIRTMGIQFIIASFTIIPQSLIDREMLFRQKAIVEFVSAVAGSLTALYLALTGWGVWSLVLGAISLNVFRTIGLNFVRPYLHLPSLSLARLSQIISFGGYVTVSRLLWLFYSQADMLIIGKFLGKQLLGFYNVAITLAYLPMERASGIINQVAFPAFSAIQGDINLASKHMLKSVHTVSLLAFPVLWGLSSVAPQLVAVFIGSKWQASVLPLQIISLVIPVRMVSNLLSPVILGLGRADIEVLNGITGSLLLPFSFLIGCQWGIIGVSLSWAIMFPIVFLINLSRVSRTMGVGISGVIASMSKPFLAAAVMYFMVLFLNSVISELDPLSRLALSSIVGALTYVGTILILDRDSYHEVRELLGFLY